MHRNRQFPSLLKRIKTVWIFPYLIFKLHFFVEVPREKVSWQAKERPIRNIYLKNCDELLTSKYFFFSKTCSLPWGFFQSKDLKNPPVFECNTGNRLVKHYEEYIIPSLKKFLFLNEKKCELWEHALWIWLQPQEKRHLSIRLQVS